MKVYFKSIFLVTALAVSISCSGPESKESAELQEIKQELAELKKELAKGAEANEQSEIIEPDSDYLAFEQAKLDGRVRAFGEYAASFVEGRHLIAADEGAWASSKRQNSVAAYEAYRIYFPKGKYIQASYKKTMSVQNRIAIKALADLDYDVAEFPTFNTASIDSSGKIELPSRDKDELKKIAKLKADLEATERNKALVEEVKRQEAARQEALRQESVKQDSLRRQAIKMEAEQKEVLRIQAKKQDALNQKVRKEKEKRKKLMALEEELKSSPRKLYVINFRDAINPANKTIDVSILQAVHNSYTEIDYVIIDFSTAAKWEKGAHEAFDRDIVPVFNRWVGLTGFVAAVDADFKYVMGCFDETFTASQMTKTLDKMSTAATKTDYDGLFGKSTNCPSEVGETIDKQIPPKFFE